MKNELEKYLESNRGRMDVEQPRVRLVWKRIRKRINQPRPGAVTVHKDRDRHILRSRILRLAAVAALLLSVGYMVTDLLEEHSAKGLESLSYELGHRESEYRNMVSVKLLEAGSYDPAEHNEVIKELYAEIGNLDTIYTQSLADLRELGYNEQVIQTIFDTYEKKIYLLELIILEQNKAKNHENEDLLLL